MIFDLKAICSSCNQIRDIEKPFTIYRATNNKLYIKYVCSNCHLARRDLIFETSANAILSHFNYQINVADIRPGQSMFNLL